MFYVLGIEKHLKMTFLKLYYEQHISAFCFKISKICGFMIYDSLLYSMPMLIVPSFIHQGQMLTLVEYLLLLYRALLPTPVWYRFFLNKEYGSLFSSLMTGLYLTFKLTSVVEKVRQSINIFVCMNVACEGYPTSFSHSPKSSILI